jgi:hypothetical protein
MGGLPGHAPGAWHEKEVREIGEEKKKTMSCSSKINSASRVALEIKS